MLEISGLKKNTSHCSVKHFKSVLANSCFMTLKCFNLHLVGKCWHVNIPNKLQNTGLSCDISWCHQQVWCLFITCIIIVYLGMFWCFVFFGQCYKSIYWFVFQRKNVHVLINVQMKIYVQSFIVLFVFTVARIHLWTLGKKTMINHKM